MNQLQAELLKIRSTRTTIGLLAGLIALALLFTILTCTLSPMSQLYTEQDQTSLLSFGSVAGVFAAQQIKPQARTLATDRGIRCMTLDYDQMRGMDSDEFRLF